MKIIVRYPSRDEERQILKSTTGAVPREPQQVLSGEEVLELQSLVRRVPISETLIDYVMSIVRATRKDEGEAPDFVKKWVLWGVGPGVASR